MFQLTCDTFVTVVCPATEAEWPGADTEKRLVKKCRELNAEIVANAAKVAAALQLSEEDQAAVTAMKREVEKAWKLVDAAHEKVAPQSPPSPLPLPSGQPAFLLYWRAPYPC